MHLFTHLTAWISTCSCLLYIESRCKYLLCFSEAVLLCMQMLLSGLYRTEWVERCPACRADRFTFLSPGVSDKILFVELIFCFLSKLFLQNLEWKLITRYETVPNSADVLCLTLRFISYHTDVSKVRMRYIYLHNRFAFDLIWELCFFLWLCRKLKHQKTFAWSHQQSSD